jgi:signal peptidase I
MEKTLKHTIVDIVINLAIIIILVLVIQKWIIAPFDVYGSSMCDTINNIEGECQSGFGEKIIINEIGYQISGPQRGEIVIFKAPQEDETRFFIKRIIGTPGDKIRIDDGEVYLTATGTDKEIKLDEPYLNKVNKGTTENYFSDFNQFDVPEGKYFLMGDNRRASTDSRTCFQPGIKISCKDNPERVYIEEDSIRGKAWVVWWPLGSMRQIDHATYPELSESLAEK